jgi:hypothetical protein
MAKNKQLPFRIDEKWLQGLYSLAGTFGATPEEVIELALPDDAVIGLFFQCKDYTPELRWDEVAAIGREAIRSHLRAKYMEGLQAHAARLGVDMAHTSTEQVSQARERALDELKADADRPLDAQIARAEADSVYLGYLYEAWKRAAGGEPGYTVAQIEVYGRPGTHKAWAVLKNGKPV